MGSCIGYGLLRDLILFSSGQFDNASSLPNRTAAPEAICAQFVARNGSNGAGKRADREIGRLSLELCGGRQPLRGADSGIKGFVGHGPSGPAVPGSESFSYEAEDGVSILINQFQPGQRTHLGKIDSAETHAGNENVDPVAQRLVLERIDSLRHGFWAVGVSPPLSHFGMSFLNGHLQRGVSHRKRNELLPVLRARQSSGGFQPFVKRRRGQWCEQSKNGQTRGPSANLFKGALRDSYGVVVHTENKRSDGVNVAGGEPLQHGCIFAGFVEALIYVGKVGRVNGLHADEDPLAA